MRLGWLVSALFPCLLGPVLLSGARGADEEQPSPDEQLLRYAGLGTDGQSLLQFFRLRAQAGADLERVRTLIRQMGNGARAAREKASAELLMIGPPAVPLLREAAKDPDDSEASNRAKRCLEYIEGSALPAAAVRLLAQRKPNGTVEGLLAYLPFADDESVDQEIEPALSRAAGGSGQPDKSLLAALEDKLPVRRAAAAVALLQSSGGRYAPAVRKLLLDPKPTVRLRVALALGQFHEQDAVPVLIALLDELPPDRGRLAEEFLISLAGELTPLVPLDDNGADRQKCRQAWSAWWRTMHARALLDFFRQRILKDQERDQIRALIRQLGDERFPVRQRASDALVALGGSAVSLLHHASKSKELELEVRFRAEDCLRRLEGNRTGITPATASRLIAFFKPAGACEVLLDYLPFADNHEVARAVQEALNALAAADEKAQRVLPRFLADPSALKRAAAAESLCRAGPEVRLAVRKLLEDPDPAVRLQVALALVPSKNREVVPVLIDLLSELPASESWQAEAVLKRLAGRQAPAEELGPDAAAQRKCRDAWDLWWQTHGRTVDLDRLDAPPRMLGHTVVAQIDVNGAAGQAWEMDASGRVRWRITDLRYPVDVQVLPRNRVLLADARGEVTERDFKGRVLWRMQVPNVIGSQRLANGNTFIAARDQLIEVDRRNRELFSYRRPAFDVVAAQKLPDGRIFCLLNGGKCLRLDASGQELSCLMVGPTNQGGMEALPNGRLLVAQMPTNKVVEYDASGKSVWEVSLPAPWSVTRLPDGHTLVACQENRVVEVDRAGKIVWDYKTDGRPLRARRR